MDGWYNLYESTIRMGNWIMGENKIINDFNEYSIWINTLKGMKEELWVAPISEGNGLLVRSYLIL